jgi:hypothetical protein
MVDCGFFGQHEDGQTVISGEAVKLAETVLNKFLDKRTAAARVQAKGGELAKNVDHIVRGLRLAVGTSPLLPPS